MSTLVFSNLLNKLTKRDKIQHWLTRLGEIAPGIYPWNLPVFPGMANKVRVANNGKYNFFAAKYWQIMANIPFLPRNTGKYDF